MRPLATHLRKLIILENELALVLRYLATGETTECLMFQFRLHKSIISQFTEPDRKAIYNGLALKYMKIPIERKNRTT